MTGAYLRVKRDGKFQSVEVEYLTDEERDQLFKHRTHDDYLRWINLLCEVIKALRPPEEDANV